MREGPLLIHDGRALRPLEVGRDLGYRAEDLLDNLDAERILYPAEHELLERIADVLARPPARRQDGPAVWVSRDDLAALGHAVEVLGRLRRRRLNELAGNTTPYVGEGADGCRRSAQIIRDELATLDAGDPRRELLEELAFAWDAAAIRWERGNRG